MATNKAVRARVRKSKTRRPPIASHYEDFNSGDLFFSVSGFKAIGVETTLRIAPLTIISGTNSAGKSSFMQPFLIMKQTLDSSFDPGALLLFGPNAKFTDASQTLTKGKSKLSQVSKFQVSMRAGDVYRQVTYSDTAGGYIIEEDVAGVGEQSIRMTETGEGLISADVEDFLSDYGESMMSHFAKGDFFGDGGGPTTLSFPVQRQRSFLDVNLQFNREGKRPISFGADDFLSTYTRSWIRLLQGIIHVPGLRGNPEREYPRSAVGDTYPGTLDTYVASIVLEWAVKDETKLKLLAGELARLGLTWKVHARRKNDAAVELLVGRMPQAQQGGSQDMVSVADVGFGVSQTLPVVVALLAAAPGQIVYLEQPEIHLHPRAQVQLAKTLVRASKRGVKVIAETHSSLLIRAIQTEIASGEIAATDVSLNWFSRDEQTGFSKVDVADLDSKGRFGDWPLDFDEIAQDADLAYISAIRGTV
ncbi:DUF3696 domain-containing protein [Arthrobacter yangruifuii]|uniref:DUF3696 domain-containing protein n=1 Tax=Arthrobacter yangruifuii TaxID=2606616 RepID=A0A5N6MTA6_9MICC|nr:AAA family ATPase [Arthrobacter yangruifuii]KAD4059930.1 DUF3696 domain-containing protein [Arthrobacter yangruifuii]